MRPDRGNEWWVDFRLDGRRVRKRSSVQTKAGAIAFEQNLIVDLRGAAAPCDVALGPPGGTGEAPAVATRAPTFAAFSEQWLLTYSSAQNSRGTRRVVESAVRCHLVPRLGSVRLHEITTLVVDGLIADLVKAGLAPKTVNNYLSTLRTSLTTAREWGLLEELPKFRWKRVDNQGYRFLTDEQATRLLAAPKTDFWRTLLLFFLHTGARCGEVAALTWEDLRLDDDDPTVVLRRSANRWGIGPTKTNRPRTLGMTRGLRDALRAHREVHRDPVFVFSNQPGKPHRFDSTRETLYRLCGRAGVPLVSWHGLRHTFATSLTSKHVSLRVVQEALGHATLEMTLRYTHPGTETIREAVSRLSYGGRARPFVTKADDSVTKPSADSPSVWSPDGHQGPHSVDNPNVPESSEPTKNRLS